jgi:hypothetical protein
LIQKAHRSISDSWFSDPPNSASAASQHRARLGGIPQQAESQRSHHDEDILDRSTPQSSADRKTGTNTSALKGGIMSGDTAEQAHMRHSIMTNLKSGMARKIDFWCNGIHVDGAGFMSVYQALAMDYFHVQASPALANNQCVYWPRKNTYYLPNANYGDFDSPIGQKSLTIHESVHALIDWSFKTPVDYVKDITSGDPSLASTRYQPGLKMVEEEAVACIAQALFRLNYYDDGSGAGAFPAFNIALAIARRIKGDDGASVTDSEAGQLQGAIAADPRYQQELARIWSAADG